MKIMMIKIKDKKKKSKKFWKDEANWIGGRSRDGWCLTCSGGPEEEWGVCSLASMKT